MIYMSSQGYLEFGKPLHMQKLATVLHIAVNVMHKSVDNHE